MMVTCPCSLAGYGTVCMHASFDSQGNLPILYIDGLRNFYEHLTGVGEATA